jgi:hypothetical protein
MRAASFRVAVLAIVALTRASAAAEPQPVKAPFGLAWGPIVEVPRPVSVDREANLTALHYLQGEWPATGSGTAEVVLVVCRDEGLQQVVWVGLPLSGRELGRARQAIHEEGVRRYGEPSRGPLANSEVWPGGRALLASRELADGRHELVMTAFGPGFAACSQSHLVSTGHPAGAHVADLVGVADH